MEKIYQDVIKIREMFKNRFIGMQEEENFYLSFDYEELQPEAEMRLWFCGEDIKDLKKIKTNNWHTEQQVKEIEKSKLYKTNYYKYQIKLLKEFLKKYFPNSKFIAKK